MAQLKDTSVTGDLTINGDIYLNNDTSYIHGNKLNLESKSDVILTCPTTGVVDRKFGENKILWSGNSQMNSDQNLTLSEAISAQPNGVVFAWSLYSNGNVHNYDWNYYFISKSHVLLYDGAGVYMVNSYAGMNKYVYIHNTSITGYSGNVGSSTVNNVAYNNNNYALRYVIGV